MQNNKHQQHNIISLEDDAKVPDTFGLERYVEEVNILELEGVYFSPNHKANLGKGPSFKELSSQPVSLVLSQYGKPGELAYKVLDAIFLKITQQGPEPSG